MWPRADLARFGLLHSACRSRTLTTTNNSPLVSRIVNTLPQRARHAQPRTQLISWSAHRTLKYSVTRNALLWVITQRVVAIPYRRFGKTYRSRSLGTKSLSLNVGKGLPLLVVQ